MHFVCWVMCIFNSHTRPPISSRHLFRKHGGPTFNPFTTAEASSLSQQTQSICITIVQCWANVEDVGPTLYKCYANGSKTLGRRCKNVIQMVCVCWASSRLRYFAISQVCYFTETKSQNVYKCINF